MKNIAINSKHLKNNARSGSAVKTASSGVNGSLLSKKKDLDYYIKNNIDVFIRLRDK